jgi:arabinogalactan endo-1,4-beta-galactosidase
MPSPPVHVMKLIKRLYFERGQVVETKKQINLAAYSVMILLAIAAIAPALCHAGDGGDRGGEGKKENVQGGEKKPLPSGYIVGADISWVQQAEDRGTRYGDNGAQKDILEILKDHGFNYIRLRVFVDPTKSTPRDRPYSAQGYCDLPHTIAMGKRVKAAGMGLFIDFHYSDSWADPGKQYAPSAWAGLSFDELVRKTRDYTKDAVEQLKAAGAAPDMVQIGNEITPGMMTDRGGGTNNWPQLGALLKAGIAGAREASPKIRIVLHIDKGGDNEATRRWVDAALEQGAEFDILAQSCYTRWQGQPSAWKANFEDLVKRYPKLSFIIAELAADVREANEVMLDLPDRKGLGTFIWEPTANNNQQALFDNRGNVIPARMALYDQLQGKKAEK